MKEDQIIVRDASGFERGLISYADMLEDASDSRLQPVAGGWFPRGKRSTHNREKIVRLSPLDLLLLLEERGKHNIPVREESRRAEETEDIPPPGFSAPRG